MKRIDLPTRNNWQQRVEEAGLSFHSQDDIPYWDESSAYAFSSQQAAYLETVCEDLHEMCMEATQQVAASEELLSKVGIPAMHHDLVAQSLSDAEPDLLGRFDLIYDGSSNPAKMIEYNSDTPVTLIETSEAQWDWLQDQMQNGQISENCSQVNDLYEAVVERFAQIYPAAEDIHFAALGDAQNNPEDYMTTETLAWAAKEAGHTVHFTKLDEIGIAATGQFVDDENQIIGTLYKLYPWEDMLQDDFAGHLAGAQCRYIEPAWKAITSSKGLLPILWEMFEGHPNLLPAFFPDDVDRQTDIVKRASDALHRGHVIKPILSRQGGGVRIIEAGNTVEVSSERCFDGLPTIIQSYQPAPVFSGFRPVLGGWVVGGKCVGLGIREDKSRITQDSCRFKPHFIQA